jgi:hypothetical protein
MIISASEELMPKTVRRRAAMMLAALAMFVVGGQSLHAQSPTVLMLYGGSLKAPVFLTEADAASFRNLLGPASVTVKDMGDRPFTLVALFWASRLNPANNGTPIKDLKPEMAWQHGRLYAPTAGQPAVLLVTPMTKGSQGVPVPSNGAAFAWGGPVSEASLAILKRTGILR